MTTWTDHCERCEKALEAAGMPALEAANLTRRLGRRELQTLTATLERQQEALRDLRSQSVVETARSTITGPREKAREIVEKWYREHPRLMIPPFERAELSWAIAAALDEAQRGACPCTFAHPAHDACPGVSSGAPTGAESGEVQGRASSLRDPRTHIYDPAVCRPGHGFFCVCPQGLALASDSASRLSNAGQAPQRGGE